MPRSREFEIIERFFTRPIVDEAIRVGIGDDAAVVDVAGPLAVAVDSIVAGTHFPDSMPASAVGHRSLAVNLSDLAAIGARPRWATLALCLPSGDLDWVKDFSAGFFALADRFGVGLIGGDTMRGPLSVTVQVMGDAATEPLLRSAGSVGDLVFVSGSIGDGAAGLQYLREGDKSDSADIAAVIERFSYPEPRVDLGIALAGQAHAAIDISDGLVIDLGRICSQSRCGAEIDLQSLPLSSALRALFSEQAGLELALNGGDDYELCFTAAPADADRVQEIAERVGTAVTAIGRLTDDCRITGRSGASSIALEAKSFAHFD